MPCESILVHVQTTSEAQPRLRAARALAERFDCVLIGVGVEMVPPPAMGAGPAHADWYAAMSASVAEDLEVAEWMFWDAACGLSKDAVWKRGFDSPRQALAAAARGADLVVTSHGPKTQWCDYRDAGAAELAIALGGPLLVTPDDAPAPMGRQVVLAWKDVREARRAMRDAMPFLKGAEKVLVLEVCDGAEETDARARVDDVVSALGRHGVAAEACVARHAGPPAQEILRHASLLDADLIVAGAYGHNRLGEWLPGGVTRDLLEQNDCYVLLSH